MLLYLMILIFPDNKKDFIDEFSGQAEYKLSISSKL